MSHLPAAEKLKDAARPPKAAPMLAVPPEIIQEAITEGVRRAFVDLFDGPPIEELREDLRLLIDLRLMKEGAFLKGDQLARMLQISERKWEYLRDEKHIPVDRTLGPQSLRHSLWETIRALAGLKQDARKTAKEETPV